MSNPNYDYDLQVYEMSSPSYANSIGTWYLTSSPTYADYILYRMSSPLYEADFSIYMTSSPQYLSNSDCE